MTLDTEKKTLLVAGYQSIDDEETGVKAEAITGGVGGFTRHRTKIACFMIGVLCGSMFENPAKMLPMKRVYNAIQPLSLENELVIED
eukprot:CAMPEP_0194376496 /NCGR_PEP_ID=MMETSP0174-20130528/25643_1 /TAXON_ID=216777 /ORGANISM="Proboscia alata, Strain PI-D3" /LENGTH=86 /DNA_ID=CAMNT_0039157175 /DNA_START=101 /DNA_END=358 /DNA_ORIENTATION=-